MYRPSPRIGQAKPDTPQALDPSTPSQTVMSDNHGSTTNPQPVYKHSIILIIHAYIIYIFILLKIFKLLLFLHIMIFQLHILRDFAYSFFTNWLIL